MSRTSNEQESSFGERLAILRKRKGYTQTELAARLGVTRRTIAYYEKESPNLPGNLLLELAVALETPLEELLSGKPIRHATKKLRGYIQDIERLPESSQERLIAVLESFLSDARGG